MFKILLKKFEESLISVLPVTVIVLILNFTPLVSLSVTELVTFIISSALLIFGIAMFNLGADLAMTPMGEHIGSGLTKSHNLFRLLFVCFLMGLFITIAEPDLTVLAEQVSKVINGTTLIIFVGIGVGIFLLLSVLKIIFKKPLSSMLFYFYMILFAIAALVAEKGNKDFLSLAFDSGGVTTGPITVPFIMALGVGIATTLGGKNVEENSFGLIAMCSVGPILAVMILGVGIDGNIDYKKPSYSVDEQLSALGHTIFDTAKEVFIALGLIVAFFVILQILCLKLPKKKLIKISIGLVYTFIGLVIFLASVSIGFMPVGYKIGESLGTFSKDLKLLLPLFGFVLGTVVVLAEPAVHVLNKQVEDITDGTVSKTSMMIALSVGVGISICLAMLRIIYGFNILWFVVPGYLVSLGLSFFVPGIYTAIAFDSGGVASGPLTSGFILPLSIGACFAFHGKESVIMSLGFGIVAMVAMTPLITIQLLGFRAVVKKHMLQRIAMKRILEADDEQIIRFM